MPQEFCTTSGTSSTVFTLPSGFMNHWKAARTSLSNSVPAPSAMALHEIHFAPQATPIVSCVATPRPVMVPVVWVPCPLVSFGNCVFVPSTSSQHCCHGTTPPAPRQRAESAG